MSSNTPGRLSGIVAETLTLDEWFKRSEQSAVPDLQRRISWIASHFDEYMDDCEAYANNSGGPPTRYVGTFLVQPGDDSESFSTHTLVDGQQRSLISLLSTSNIAHMYEERGEDDAAQFLREEYLSIATRTGRKPRMVLTELDNEAFQTLLEDPTATTTHEPLNKLNAAIQDAFNERVESLSDLEDLEELMLERQAIVIISVEDTYSPYRLFDERNGRGAPLTAVDRVKNRLLEVADEDPSTDLDTVKEEWWRFRRALESHNETRALRYILMAGDLVPVTTKLSGSDLYETVDHILDERLDDNGLDKETFVTWLANAAEDYSSISLPSYHHPAASTAENDQINRHLRNLNLIGAKPARILVLGAHLRGVSPQEMREILILAEKFSFVRRVVQRRIPQEIRAYIRILHGSDSTNSAFMQPNVVEAVKNGLTDEMPSDEEFFREFERHSWGPRSDKTKYALVVLEHEHYQGGNSNQFGGPVGSASIEHIIPYRYGSKKYRKWHNYLSASPEELELDVNRIGNLTLLEESKNIEADDDPYEQKRDPHYIASAYAMANTVAANYSQWGLAEIEQRSEEMASAAVNIWSL